MMRLALMKTVFDDVLLGKGAGAVEALNLRLGSLQGEGWSAAGVQLALSLPEAGGSGLRLRAERLERRREIGVMRAIGAVDFEIMKSVVIEGVMIGTHSGQGISFVSRGQIIKDE